ncbi:MAG: efflux RND transporter periplasmic adaptor subunit, partial [Gemmatimonadetes bacterium]|nr:efflux RND transporter periplasmic adaptor subunit [Gemmatimonadota bacterium]
SGKVTEGDVVWGGTSLLSLPDLRAMQVVSQIGEMDVTRVKPGQEALIRLEAFPGPVFHGEVAAVAPMAGEVEDAPNVHVFEMVVDIEDQDDRLYPGMSAAVEIVLQSIPDVVRVPLSAVRLEEERAIVWRSGAGGFTPVEVTAGPHNGTEVAIESGLEAGDVVALHASSVPLPP